MMKSTGNYIAKSNVKFSHWQCGKGISRPAKILFHSTRPIAILILSFTGSSWHIAEQPPTCFVGLLLNVKGHEYRARRKKETIPPMGRFQHHLRMLLFCLFSSGIHLSDCPRPFGDISYQCHRTWIYVFHVFLFLCPGTAHGRLSFRPTGAEACCRVLDHAGRSRHYFVRVGPFRRLGVSMAGTDWFRCGRGLCSRIESFFPVVQGA